MTELTQYVYAFDKANEPIARAKDGDEFSFRTLDCYSGQVCTEEDIVGESFNFSRTNPATGPLYVEGAMPGDVLVVDVLSVEVADKGAVTTIPNIGPLYDRCVDRTRILPVKDGKTELGGLSIPINPMIGVAAPPRLENPSPRLPGSMAATWTQEAHCGQPGVSACAG
ncbi:MAG: acetamidase/formamidase family protein [Bilophila wadsworthia]